VGRITDLLCWLHDYPSLDVSPFLLSAEQRAWLQPDSTLPEELLIIEEEDTVDVGLYLEPETLARLQAQDPFRRLGRHNLDDFCVILEGISHLLLMQSRVRTGRPVRLIELELQAEVDKFVAGWLLLAGQGAPVRAPQVLGEALFSRYHLRAGVHHAERYHLASQAARRYCRHLQQRYARPGSSALRRDVREFANRPLSEKI
jgi:hypothetical protein